MKTTLLILSWLFAGGLCVKGDAVKKEFKVKGRAVSRRNVNVTADNLYGKCIGGDELGLGEEPNDQAQVTSTKVYGSVIAGDEHSSASEFAVKEDFSMTETVTIDRSMLLGTELEVEGSDAEPTKANELYVEHVAQQVIVGDELGIIDEISRKDVQAYKGKVDTAKK